MKVTGSFINVNVTSSLENKFFPKFVFDLDIKYEVFSRVIVQEEPSKLRLFHCRVVKLSPPFA